MSTHPSARSRRQPAASDGADADQAELMRLQHEFESSGARPAAASLRRAAPPVAVAASSSSLVSTSTTSTPSTPSTAAAAAARPSAPAPARDVIQLTGAALAAAGDASVAHSSGANVVASSSSASTAGTTKKPSKFALQRIEEQQRAAQAQLSRAAPAVRSSDVMMDGMEESVPTGRIALDMFEEMDRQDTSMSALLSRVVEKERVVFTPRVASVPLERGFPAAQSVDWRALQASEQPDSTSGLNFTQLKQPEGPKSKRSIFSQMFDAQREVDKQRAIDAAQAQLGSADRPPASKIPAATLPQVEQAASSKPLIVERDIIKLSDKLVIKPLVVPDTAAGPAKNSEVDFLAPLPTSERDQIATENDNRLSSMSKAEILEAQEEIRRLLGPDAIRLLTTGKRQQQPNSSGSVPIPNAASDPSNSASSSSVGAASVASLPAQVEAAAPANDTLLPSDPDAAEAKRALDTLLDANHRSNKEWVNMDVVEQDKLAWIVTPADKPMAAFPQQHAPSQSAETSPDAATSSSSNTTGMLNITQRADGTLDVQTPRDQAQQEAAGANAPGTKVRFDFQGAVVPLGADIPADRALHHHGDEPDAAGYTIGELLILARSALPAQNVLALNLLANIAGNAWLGQFANSIHASVLETLVDGISLPLVLRHALDSTHSSVMAAAIRCLASLSCPGLHASDTRRRTLAAADAAASSRSASSQPLQPSRRQQQLDTEFVASRSVSAPEERYLDDNFLFAYRGYELPSFRPTVQLATAAQEQQQQERKQQSFDMNDDNDAPQLTDEQKAKHDIVIGFLDMQLLDRLRYILEVCQLPGVADDVLRILIRIARHSFQGASHIVNTPRLITYIRDAFLATQLPAVAGASPQSAADVYAKPRALAIKLMRVITQVDRSLATTLISNSVPQAVMPFLLQGPVDALGELEPAAGLDHLVELARADSMSAEDVDARFALAIETLNLWRALALYGLYCDPWKTLFGSMMEQFLAVARLDWSTLLSATLLDLPRGQAIAANLLDWTVAFVNLAAALTIVAADPQQAVPTHAVHWSHAADLHEPIALLLANCSLVVSHARDQQLQDRAMFVLSVQSRITSACFRFFSVYTSGARQQVPAQDAVQVRVGACVRTVLLPRVLSLLPQTLSRLPIAAAERLGSEDANLTAALSAIFEASSSLAALPSLPIRQRFSHFDDALELALSLLRFVNALLVSDPAFAAAVLPAVVSPFADAYIAAYTQQNPVSSVKQQQEAEAAIVSGQPATSTGTASFAGYVGRRQGYVAFELLEALRLAWDGVLASGLEEDSQQATEALSARVKQQRLGLCIFERLHSGDEYLAKHLLVHVLTRPVTRDFASTEDAHAVFFEKVATAPTDLVALGWKAENLLRQPRGAEVLRGAYLHLLAPTATISHAEARHSHLPLRLGSFVLPSGKQFPPPADWMYGPIAKFQSDATKLLASVGPLFELRKKDNRAFFGDQNVDHVTAIQAETLQFVAYFELLHGAHTTACAVALGVKVARMMLVFLTQGDGWRDDQVQACLRTLLANVVSHSQLAGAPTSLITERAPAWTAPSGDALPSSSALFATLLPPPPPPATKPATLQRRRPLHLTDMTVPRFDAMYREFVQRFLGVSFSDPVFGSFVLLCQIPSVSPGTAAARRMLWTEHSDALRMLLVDPVRDLPFHPAHLLDPLELDVPLLEAMARALLAGQAQRAWSSVLYGVALHHVVAFAFEHGVWALPLSSNVSADANTDSADVGLLQPAENPAESGDVLVAKLAASRQSILTAILACQLHEPVRDLLTYQPLLRFAAKPDASRLAILRKLAGDAKIDSIPNSLVREWLGSSMQ
ncbi:hypothetical protein CAOG_04870 [Capsaspora owczarzaki ATCC 30864]|nr:hypothetical protein CAOG_04870 [Capsaspora owczarzaki ATCC 30864]|eukprot:XP_004347621.1 hypothetical protein CAOG_04870 [Capsaspora owczarzaki ATCC 30864]